MDRYPEQDRHPDGWDEHLDDVVDIGIIDDKTRRIAGGPSGRRLGVSMPGAIAGVFLVTALAVGAAMGPAGLGLTGAQGQQADEPGPAAGAGGSSQSLGHGGSGGWIKDGDHFGGDAKPGTELVDGDGPEGDAPEGDKPTGDDHPETDKPADKPADEPKPEPVDTPEYEALEIALALDGAHVVVKWSACERDAFRYYKVVRSTNEAVTWPPGIGDSLVGAVESMTKTALVDTKAPAGKKLYYRVFALVQHDGKLVVACRSGIKAITTKPAPADKPDAATLGIELAIVEGHPKIRWSECPADFDYYKVVRSADSTVTWPAGTNDKVVGVVGRDGDRKVYDGDAPAGKKVWYRVFCVRSAESGYKVVAASAAKAIQTPSAEPKPTPEPSILDFAVVQTPDGVVLEWEACGTDGFRYYKVVRSMTNTKPTFPVNDGTQVIAVIEDHTKTRFVDTNIEPGQTWYYRVVSVGYWGEQMVILGKTPVASLTVE